MILGVILAAGEAKRMGEPKQLLDWFGEPILTRVVKNVLASGFDLVRVVTGAYSERVSELLTGLDLEIIFNPSYREGQSTSVRAGLDNCPTGIDGVAFILGDQPLITVDTFNHLIQEFKKDQSGILIPTHQGQRGNPIFFHRRFFSQLMSIEGDRGGREIIHQNPDQVRLVDLSDSGILLDLDSREDYQRLLQRQNNCTASNKSYGNG